jgi:uncharacterized protein (TIGR04255 family)
LLPFNEAHMVNQTLPSFDAPPLVETLLGVEFDPIEEWAAPYFGLYWSQIKAKYPEFDVRTAIGSPDITLDEFGTVDIPIRCWFYAEESPNLIQIQKDRFLYNWRNYLGNTEYPRYTSNRETFRLEWLRFCDFLKSNEIELPRVKRCEIAYINHIEKGQGWETMADLPDIFPGFSVNTKNKFLPVPETVDFSLTYLMPDKKGRLDIELDQVIDSEGGKEILQLQLDATGKPASSDIGDILQWLDFAREYIIQSFVDFTSVKLHDIWKKRETI